jgi:hypothetical protein
MIQQLMGASDVGDDVTREGAGFFFPRNFSESQILRLILISLFAMPKKASDSGFEFEENDNVLAYFGKLLYEAKVLIDCVLFPVSQRRFSFEFRIYCLCSDHDSRGAEWRANVLCALPEMAQKVCTFASPLFKCTCINDAVVAMQVR